MKWLFLPIVAAVASLLVIGCTQASPAPTTAPTAPPKSSEPTKAPAPSPTALQQPTSAPTRSAVFPEKGRPITVIVPYAAGGGVDVAARLLASSMEKDLGTPFTVVNRPGAGTQVGTTELAKSKPDGYTIGMTNSPSVITIYLDPDRKAAFSRKDLQPLAVYTIDQTVVAVRSDSPFKSLKDLVDAAKANPNKIRTSDVGIMTGPHLAIVEFQQVAGVKFANVHFESSAQGVTALLGGHIDAQFAYINNVLPQLKSGEFRLIGIFSKEPSKYMPEVKTAESQGYKIYSVIYRGISMPAGAPKEIIDTLAGAIKRAVQDPEYVSRMESEMYTVRYMGPEEFAAQWDSDEVALRPLVELAKKE